jgi:hypothetical protein
MSAKAIVSCGRRRLLRACSSVRSEVGRLVKTASIATSSPVGDVAKSWSVISSFEFFLGVRLYGRADCLYRVVLRPGR